MLDIFDSPRRGTHVSSSSMSIFIACLQSPFLSRSYLPPPRAVVPSGDDTGGKALMASSALRYCHVPSTHASPIISRPHNCLSSCLRIRGSSIVGLFTRRSPRQDERHQRQRAPHLATDLLESNRYRATSAAPGVRPAVRRGGRIPGRIFILQPAVPLCMGSIQGL